MKSAQKELKTLQQTAKELGKDNSLEGLGKQAQNSKKQLENLTKQLKSQKDEMERLEKKTQEYRQELQKVEKGSKYYDELTEAIQRTEKRMQELNNEMQLTEARTKNASNEMKKLYTNIDRVGDESNNSSNQLGEINSKMDDMGSKISTINKMDFGQNLLDASREILNVVGQIIEGYGILIQAGSEFSSNNAQTEMVFGNLGKETQKQIENNTKLAESFAMTERQYRSGATELASYYKAMGYTDEAIAEMIPSQMQLVADMSAMANVPFDEALGDYKSALMGNHEAVDKYNISLAESTMNESEYAKSIGKTVSQMTEQEKINARNSVMFQQTADYMGLATKEAEEFTAQQNLMNTQLDELKGTIGEKLLPIFEPFVKAINDVVGKFAEWVEKNPEAVETLGELVIAITSAIATIGVLIGILGALAIAMAIVDAVGAPIVLTIGAIVLAIGALVAGLVMLWLNWDEVCAWVSKTWSTFCDWVCSTMDNLKQWLSNAWQYLCENIPIWIDNMKQWVIDKWKAMCEFVSTKATEIKEWVVNKFKELVEKASKFFSELPYNVGKFIGETLRKVIDWGKQMKEKAIDTAKTFIDNTIKFFSELPNKIWNWFVQTVLKVKQWSSDMKAKATEVGTQFVNKVVEFVKQLPSKLWTWFVNTVQKVQQWKTDMVNKGKQAGQELVNTVVNKIKELPSKVVSIGRNIVESLWKGITGATQWLKSKVGSFIDGIVAGFTGGKDSMIKVVGEYENNADGTPNTVFSYGKDFERKTISLASLDTSYIDTSDYSGKSGYYTSTTGTSMAFNQAFNPNYQSGGSLVSSNNNDNLSKKLDMLISLLMDGKGTMNVNIENVAVDAKNKDSKQIMREISDYMEKTRKRW